MSLFLLKPNVGLNTKCKTCYSKPSSIMKCIYFFIVGITSFDAQSCNFFAAGSFNFSVN